MGRRGHNWKARQVVDVDKQTIDRTEELNIKLDLQGIRGESYDDSNVLALPSTKRKTKLKVVDERPRKKLTKKKRKELERVLDKKVKESKRKELLAELEKVQATPEELSQLMSITEMHAGRLKPPTDKSQPTHLGDVKINSIAGAGRKRKQTKQLEVATSSDSSDINTSDMSTDEEMCEDPARRESAVDVAREAETCMEAPVNRDEAEDEAGTGAGHVGAADVSLSRTVIQAKARVVSSRPATHVPVMRKKDVQEQRLKLPILMEEQAVMEAINDNPVVIVCGETGSGKTTQVPQFLYEAGYAERRMIGVTQPRRVAAICMAQRVAQELNTTSREVSYQIRYEGNATTDTKIKFMTDGVLLKEMQNDFLLRKYEVIILDEAHERSVYTDILIGMLSRCVEKRHEMSMPLKLVVMSATLQVSDFTGVEADRQGNERKDGDQNRRVLFRTMTQPKVPLVPPIIQIESRQFPVEVHFNRRTEDDYLTEAYKKICKIHQKLPDGGILVFVTSQQEVHTLCSKLKKSFHFGHGSGVNKSAKDKDCRSRKMRKSKNNEKNKSTMALPNINLDDYSTLPVDDEENELIADYAMLDSDCEAASSGSESEADAVVSHEDQSGGQPMHVLPLFSLLSAEKQARVFQERPVGSRLCVISTNVAETSLTIPGIKYVVDSGKVKTKIYDKVTGVCTFRVTWISKASANQRTGRAGRTGPGYSYRLYSSAVFESFESHSVPEIRRRPIDDLVLQMKDMGIPDVIKFPFPTLPDLESLRAAEKLLVSLGALGHSSSAAPRDPATSSSSLAVTPLGRTMARFPVSPRYAKMLSLGHQYDILPYTIALVAAMSVQELFVDSTGATTAMDDEGESSQQNIKHQSLRQMRRTWAGTGESLLLGDMMVLLRALGACEYAGASRDFCDAHGLRHKAVVETRKLRKHLTNAVNLAIPSANLILQPQMSPPTELQAKLIRQIVLTGLGDHVARKIMAPVGGSAEEKKKMSHAYQDMLLEEPVFIHPSSVLYRSKHEFVVYQSLEETSKLYMKGVAAVEADWLPVYAASQCSFSLPQLDNPPPRYDNQSGRVMCSRQSTFGLQCWPMPDVEVALSRDGDCMRWFARFLLEGAACAPLRQFVPLLLLSPCTMVKKWAMLQPRTTKLLDALASEQVFCRDDLLKAWHKDSKYLLKEYREWIPESQHKALLALWPPV